MRLFLAIFVPWILFFTIRRPIAGFVCLVLQVTVIGWIPAAIWAVHALGQFKTDKKIGAMERKLEKDAQETAEGAGADSAEAPDRTEPGP